MKTIKSQKRKRFDKKSFRKNELEWLKEQGWNDVSDQIDSILFTCRLDNLPYKPEMLIEKDGIKFFVQSFQKGDWALNKKFGYLTGFDSYKYSFLMATQRITGIQVGVIVWREVEKIYRFMQLDQLPHPIYYFGEKNCLQHRHKFFECWEAHPLKVIHYLKRKKKRREMVMWDARQFHEDLIIQPRLI